MKRKTLLHIFLVISVLALVLGGLFKILHWPSADTLLLVALLAALGFIVTALYEIVTSQQAPSSQKTLWMTAVLLGGPLGALLYLQLGRQLFAAKWTS